MDLEDTEEFEELAALTSGFANRTRLALLIGFYKGYSATDVTEFLGVSRPGAQKNIEQMVDADLVYRPAADDTPTYALTPLGEFFARIYEAYGPILLAAVTLLRQTETDVHQELQESPVADSLSEAEQEKLVHTRKWQQVDDQLQELLGLDTDIVPPAAESPEPSRSFAFDSSLSAEEIGELLEAVQGQNDEEEET